MIVPPSDEVRNEEAERDAFAHGFKDLVESLAQHTIDKMNEVDDHIFATAKEWHTNNCPDRDSGHTNTCWALFYGMFMQVFNREVERRSNES